MLIVISYDIISDKRRNKIANTIKDYGTRVQYSVFECILNTEKYAEMIQRILKIYNNIEDTIRVYHICNSCKDKIEVYGIGKLTEDKETYII